ncbi:hypothetical protein FA95DRAFT_899338 [Auriscalpium vulgare]|uniref:Uncharacterized protein n=1 Tax=Auriscalpium vulgare TaxID=40419 RepID=A0ACB8R865_9AGAM|nr:hypothetical protein FA95DRAFT_899338 [Auriscalpium vulgare]
MFTLPQPFSSPNSGLTQIADEKKGLPIVHMAENSKILSSLLMAVYSPAITSMPSCLEDAFELLNAAQKFGMDDTTSLIRILLSHNDRTPLITPDNAVRAYGLAKFHSLAIEALLAARCTLHLPCSLEFYAPNLRILDGASIYELACYRARCRDAVLGCIEAARSGKLPSADKWLAPAPNVDGQSSTCKSLKEPGATPEVPTWWDQHLERLAEGVKEGTRHPSAKTVVNLVALQAALDKHVEDESCEYCRRVYVRREEKFCTMLEDEINDAIQKVQLDLPW